MKFNILGSRSLSLSFLVFLAACDGSQAPESSATFATPVAVNTTETAAVATTPGDVKPTPFVWPADKSVVDPNHYYEGQDTYSVNNATYMKGPNGGKGDTGDDIKNAGLDLAQVDETPSSKHHQMVVNNQTIDYTARAGHLIAHAPTDPANPNAARDAEASIFYMSYTRDDIPAEKRPVTFFFNGGPGEPSIWLHLGSWATKHLEVNAPYLADGPDMPNSFPLVDNPQTLLDQSDMVFVDLVGSGLSEAIKPHKNGDFWNTNSDAQIFRDFITAYINRYHRQSSPKYLYGESYSGIRTPIVANLLVKAGTSQYEPDPSGKPAVVLSGFVLQSPVLDYAGYGNLLPTYGMTADYYGKGTARGTMSKGQYVDYLRYFTTEQYRPVKNGWLKTSDEFEQKLSAITGLPVEYTTDYFGYIEDSFPFLLGTVLYPSPQANEINEDVSFNGYDLRTSKATKLNYDISFYEDAGFYGAIKPHLLDEFGYQNKDATQIYGADVAFGYWKHNHGADGDTSVPDLVEALALSKDLHVMVAHGYSDTATPFFQTEVDLRDGGALPQFDDRITVKDYDGGHMTYLTPASHVAGRADLRNFYNPPATVASLAKTSGAAR